jgi:hypothetical protein
VMWDVRKALPVTKFMGVSACSQKGDSQAGKHS